MQRNRILILATFLLTVGLSLLALLLPTPATWPPENVEFHQQLIVNIIMATTHTGGALLLLVNLDVYKAGLRRAYILLAIGTLATGLGTLQISILTLLNSWETFYASSGATMLPFLLSGVLLYLAMRAFAGLIEMQHVLARASVVLSAAIVLALLSSFLPHAQDPRISEVTYDVLVGVSVWSGSLMLLAGILASQVRHHTGAHYSHAMKWLTRALIVSASVLLYQAVYTLINVGFNPVLNLASNTITILSGVAWVRAGYAFALTKYFDEDVPFFQFVFGRMKAKVIHDTQTVVDMVTSTAQLVSNPQDIDLLLDDVRTITSKLKPGERPSIEDTRSLVEVYLEIEEYLTTQELLRKFTRKELRARLSPELRKLVAMYSN